ncbi:hypothetical protein ACIPLC_10225 [Kitasatospora sp. NPDC086801]|uniref:hypothetical protein n=1 Tax=Kitasatospora sp. NPDC086801 TaxID=3364066 RepID=UPI00382D8720
MPSKPRRRTGGFADLLVALPPREEDDGFPLGPHPLAAGGFVDADGCRWRLARGPLHPRRAKRLAVEADAMTLGAWHQDFPDALVPVLLAPEERPAAWLEVRDRFDAPDPPSHQAYEFVAADGRTLLYINTRC